MTTYREAGVDNDEGDRVVEQIKPFAQKTLRQEVLSGVGGFAGLFALPLDKYREPVLVSGTDGVGTKLKLAFQAGRHDTVGIDLVAMSVNDIAVCGAEPLFFLDYYATSRLRVDDAAKVIQGIAEGCHQSGCTLLGGETAEMPGFYSEGEYDLAGFAVGVVERSKIIDGKKVQVGDVVLGVGSSGLHSNGYSLVRKIMEKSSLTLESTPRGLDRPLVDLLLAPTKIYAKHILELQQTVEVLALAHITGGGIPGNLPRTLPQDTCALVRPDSWPRAPLFDFLAQEGAISPEEMLRTFNMGIGLTVVVRKTEVAQALRVLHHRDLKAWEIGEIVSGAGEASVRIA